MSRADLTRELESRLSTGKGKAPTRRKLAAAAAPSGRIYAVHVPGAVQSVITVAHVGPPRTAADFEATSIMAQIFGGSFSSRVNMNLREDKGYAYGARGGFSYRRAGSHLSVYASVEVTTTALALGEIAKEMKVMRDTAPTEIELVRERDGALQSLPARFAKPASTLDELRSLHYFGLPFDWFSGHEKRLAALDVAAIHEAAQKHLPETGLTVLVVGDLDQIEKGSETGRTVREALKTLANDKVFGAGGFQLLDADGHPL